ncbi:PCYCGC domain-containing protein [Paenibacillus sp. J2TS4]|uniref:PCYCGC domain-containing protein n=1 Tax=Paenibacillus sp. J2TS4 TaxID=2807194 RepID=UPI001B23804C|nr:PCYCGC domain-containing protein [Paenibacillus sp. J2TS4]GIP34265.1 hypothetical protein J2TS4_34750 [Paenibacillus sp. J2TS4]
MMSPKLARTRWLTMLVLVLLTAIFVSACGATEAGNHDQDKDAVVRLPNGDIQERTASADQLPSFLDGQHEIVVHAYQTAAAHTDLLDWMPCYCGCGEVAGHKSNKNCFIKEVAEDGSVVWDDHGTRCNVCIEIVEVSAQLKAKGQSDKEIRELIDKAYQEGYAPPTKTPIPQ